MGGVGGGGEWDYWEGRCPNTLHIQWLVCISACMKPSSSPYSYSENVVKGCVPVGTGDKHTQVDDDLHKQEEEREQMKREDTLYVHTRFAGWLAKDTFMHALTYSILTLSYHSMSLMEPKPANLSEMEFLNTYICMYSRASLLKPLHFMDF